MLKNATFHHIGIAVASINKVKTFYLSAGYVVSEPVIEPIQKVRVSYARKEGFPTVELLEPLDEKSPVHNILKKNGNIPYHICYAVDNIQEAMKEARAEGFIPLGKPIPGRGLDDAMMFFVYNKNVGLLQIMEKTK